MKNICIVGGGTSGWLSAFLISNLTDYKVTIIDSDKVPTIGVGEGTTGIFTDVVIKNYVHKFNLNINELEFLHACDATYKLGINFEGWTKKDYFEPIDLLLWGRLSTIDVDHNIERSIVSHLVNSDYDMSESTYFSVLNKYNKNVRNDDVYAYHFDSDKICEFLKTKSNVTIKNLKVNHVLTNENGIDEIILEDDTRVKSDFFIDCTGFRRALIKELSDEWINFNQFLPVNSAYVYRENKQIANRYTNAKAMNCGWKWTIPTRSRTGNGYIFSDNFCSHDEAVRELDVEPDRLIKFDSGHLKYSWNKNCIAIGLSSVFLEPMEATSIHTTIVQILTFLELIRNNQFAIQYNNRVYNDYINKLVEHFRDFILLHYRSGKQDTEFWKYMQSDSVKTDTITELEEVLKYDLPTQDMFGSIHTNQTIPYGTTALWYFVLIANGMISKSVSKKYFEKLSDHDKQNTINQVQKFYIESRNLI